VRLALLTANLAESYHGLCDGTSTNSVFTRFGDVDVL